MISIKTVKSKNNIDKYCQIILKHKVHSNLPCHGIKSLCGMHLNDEYPDEIIKKISIAFDGDKPIGCAIVSLFCSSYINDINVFVKCNYRRRKIGTQLVNESTKMMKTVGVCYSGTGGFADKFYKSIDKEKFQ